MNEIIADTRTAAAHISFTFFITGLTEGQTRSHNFSIAELIISKLNTRAKQARILIHSVLLNEKKIPAIKITKAITYCILKFFS